jgi:hypothetical protein
MAQPPFKRSCFGAMEGGVPPCVQFLNSELTSKFYENCSLEREKEGCFSISLKSQRLKYW